MCEILRVPLPPTPPEPIIAGAELNCRNAWVFFFDENQNGYCDVTSTTNPNPIVVHQALNAHLTLTALAASIYFSPSGTQGAGGATTLTLAGDWTGAVTNVATIAATGNITKTP